MINNEHKFNIKDYPVLWTNMNGFVDELLATIRITNSFKNHSLTFSSMYFLMFSSNAIANIENARSLVVKTLSSNFDKKQKAVIAQKIKDMISYTAEDTLLKVKRANRIDINIFKNIIKKIILEVNLFDKYCKISKDLINAYYEQNSAPLKENPKTEITHSSYNRYGNTKKVF